MEIGGGVRKGEYLGEGAGMGLDMVLQGNSFNIKLWPLTKKKKKERPWPRPHYLYEDVWYWSNDHGLYFMRNRVATYKNKQT